jgi:DNA-binding CsgD family transcriptional regulator
LKVPFNPRVDTAGLLTQAARPVLDQLMADLAAVRVAVVLADGAGHVMERRSADRWLSALLDHTQLSPGFVYAEEAVGTNAIGTALVRRRPATVDGAEHFADALTRLAGAASPISDPRRGNVIGVIGLMAPAADANPLMVPLVTRAAREIEQRLLDVAGVSERLMLQRFLRERRRAKGPLVFVTQRTMIPNTVAEGLIRTDDDELLRECAVGLRDGTLDHTSPIVLSSGIAVTVRGEPLMDGGSQIGTILRLTPVAASGTGGGAVNGRQLPSGWRELTKTERRVVDLVVEGLTNRETAQRLFLSHHTVGFHLRSVFTKLGVNSRVELTRLAVQQAGSSDVSGPAHLASAASR